MWAHLSHAVKLEGNVLLEPAAAMLNMLTLVMFNFYSTKLWEWRDQKHFVGTSDAYLPKPRDWRDQY